MIPGCLAHRLDHGIDLVGKAFPGGEGLVGTDADSPFPLLLVAGGDPHAAPHRFAQHDGCGGDASAGSLHQDRLTGRR